MKRYLFSLGLLVLASCGNTAVKCPQENSLKENLSKLIPRDFKVVEVKPSSEVKGLCEVVIKIGMRPLILYTDSSGKFVLSGTLFNLETKENLTQKKLQNYMTVSKETLKKLEKHVNMTYGKGEKFVYYITDPDCPFCRRFSPMIKEWADKNNVQIKVILFPLPIHPEAYKKSVAMVCDKLGYDSIHADVDTKNQCEEGKKAIDANKKLLSEIGVSGTPTVIGMNGRYIVGLPRSVDVLNELIQ